MILRSQYDKVLVTGASGRTSGYVIRALLNSASPPDLRLFVRSEAAIKNLTSQDPRLKAAKFAIGDFLEESTLPPAVQGVDVIFHNAPALHPNETAMGIALIESAKAAGVKHFVYCSVIHPQLTKLLNHKVKRECVVSAPVHVPPVLISPFSVEEYLIESGLDYTILQV